MKVAIVGTFSGTHIGGSFARAADGLGLDKLCIDVADAWRGNRISRAISWRLRGRRPPRLDEFSNKVVAVCRDAQPDCLVATGNAALTGHALLELKKLGVTCVNFSTDDPWNPVHRARWYLRALPTYDIVFTPRRSNIDDFRHLGCSDVRYLMFGYDEALVRASVPPLRSAEHDVLFVGGADLDRVKFFSEFMKAGSSVSLVGGYWSQFRATKQCALGHKNPEELRVLTGAAKVNLCLVRRANRDGHVMRSFEIPAIGGCMIAEDTAEHREIFGADGECVNYFRTPIEAAERARALIASPAERARLSIASRNRIGGGRHSYRDRLAEILDAVSGRRQINSDKSILASGTTGHA